MRVHKISFEDAVDNFPTAKERHGDAHTRLYKIWAHIKGRCYNQNNDRYAHYGGRGIQMCDEWRDSYKVFKKWAMENGYQDDLSIDRIDIDGNYEPNNCKWSTIKEQNNNTRRNIIVEDGLTLMQWCEKHGRKDDYNAIHVRIYKGWSFEDAVTIPIDRH